MRELIDEYGINECFQQAMNDTEKESVNNELLALSMRITVERLLTENFKE